MEGIERGVVMGGYEPMVILKEGGEKVKMGMFMSVEGMIGTLREGEIMEELG